MERYQDLALKPWKWLRYLILTNHLCLSHIWGIQRDCRLCFQLQSCKFMGLFFLVNVLRAPASSSRHVQLFFGRQSKLSALGLDLGGGFLDNFSMAGEKNEWETKILGKIQEQNPGISCFTVLLLVPCQLYVTYPNLHICCSNFFLSYIPFWQ